MPLYMTYICTVIILLNLYSVTRLSQRLLPNVVPKFYQIGFFFTKHVQIPPFEISGCVQSM